MVVQEWGYNHHWLLNRFSCLHLQIFTTCSRWRFTERGNTNPTFFNTIYKLFINYLKPREISFFATALLMTQLKKPRQASHLLKDPDHRGRGQLLSVARHVPQANQSYIWVVQECFNKFSHVQLRNRNLETILASVSRSTYGYRRTQKCEFT